MDLDGKQNRFQRLIGLSRSRLVILLFLGAVVVVAYVFLAFRAERQAVQSANQTLAAVESSRFAFKVSQLSQQGMNYFDQSIEENDPILLEDAIVMIGAAIGFARSPAANENEQMDVIIPLLEEMRDLIQSQRLAIDAASHQRLHNLLTDVERGITLYEQKSYRLFLDDFYRLQTVDYRQGVTLRIFAASIVAGFLVCATLLFFMRAEQLQTNRRIEAETASRAKSAFLANMSHEIRTPMNGIVGLVELLKDSPLSDDQQQMITHIQDSSFFLLGIIDDILDAAKIDAGKMTLEQTAFNMLEAIEMTSETVALQARSQNVRLMVYVDPLVPDFVIGDPLRLRQIVLNLLSNAIKFSAREGGQSGLVQLWVEPHETRTGIRIRVIDDGIGMTPEVVARIFQPFNQGEESTTRKYGGTGLGLVITRNLVDLMAGHMAVESTPDQGSTFTVFLPLPAGAGDAPLPDISGSQLILKMNHLDFNDRMARYFEHRGAVVSCPETDADMIDAVKAAGPETVVLLALGTLEENLEQVDDLRLVNPSCQIVVLDPSCGNPKGLVGTGLYASYRYPMHHSDMMRGIAVLLGRLEAGRPTHEAGAFGQPASDAMLPQAGTTPMPTVLVVEDNPLNLAVISRQLTTLGYAFDTATNGAEGLEKWRKGGYAAILTDCQMPVMDGLAMTRAIRDAEKAGRNRPIPILGISASALPEESARSMEAGMSEYLTKPLQLPQLSQALTDWVA
ncbi:ATP-binding protein [Thalassobius sp. MITS945101]|uniref:ATP-binding protein n=1 Tax=Thalassobius sp. MITS945101 TaxID=3096994 RepID=UPI00399AEC01